MPRKHSVRLNFIFPLQFRKRLDTLATRHETSMTEIIKRAVDTLKLLDDVQQDGGEIIIRDVDGNEKSVVLV